MITIKDLEQQRAALSTTLLKSAQFLRDREYENLSKELSAALCISVWLKFAEATESETASVAKLIGEINSIPEPEPQKPAAASKGVKLSVIPDMPFGIVDKNHLLTVCKASRGPQACRFLLIREQGEVSACTKGTTLGRIMDERAYANKGSAAGNNCAGPPTFKKSES